MSSHRPPARHAFEYAVMRVVPRVERAESINAGVVLYCRTLNYLDARVHLEVDRVRALDPAIDTGPLESALDAIAAACRAPVERSQPVQDIGSRFRWLTAPRSTVVQPGPVHTGLTLDPAAELERLLTVLVLPLK
jgi:hypothetical protein